MRFSIITLLLMSICILPATGWDTWWVRHYRRIHIVEVREHELESRIRYCALQDFWAFVFDEPRPRCSSIINYSAWQTDGSWRWCVGKKGIPIEFTRERVEDYSYDCSETRECPSRRVSETSGRCDATCEEARSGGYKTTFGCKKECICPRGMYLDYDDNCVWLDECPEPRCQAPMVYSTCASKCPLTCATRTHTCGHGCVKGCTCPKGAYLLTQNSKLCMKEKDCPKCDYGSLAAECVPTCPDTCPGNGECNNKEECEEGTFCVCEPGKIRLDRKLPVRCVRPEECPPICEAPKVPKGCGTACPATCDEPEPICTEQCVRENICSCPDGQVQRSKTDKTCVTLAECVVCKSPAIPIECTRACPPNCEKNGIFCSRKCNSPYVCGCPKGYVQKSVSADNVECIKEDDCPAKCPPLMIYKNCPSMCQPTCQNRTIGSCKRGCNAEKCICPKDMVKPDEDTLECIYPKDCPTICQPPRVAKGCGTACPATCEDPEPICTQQCVPENICACPDGFVQRGKTDTTCVKLAECFDCVAPAFPVKCETTCPESCEGKPIVCSRECPSKFVCGCPDGYILLTRNGKECVKKDSCPPKCPKPQRYAKCASMCQPTCQNLKPASCRRGCNVRRCFCPLDMVQPDDDTYTCIYPSECPQECTEPKINEKCPSKCQPTCQDPTPDQENCDDGCRDDKCVCPKGLIQLSNEDKTCVKAAQCPKQCTFPEVRANCRSSCVARCDNVNTLDALECSVDCGEEVCVCADGYVQRSESDPTCVAVSDCPPLPTRPPVDCTAPKVYVQCATRCPGTCEDPKPLACLRGCDPTVSCMCPESKGYVQRDKENTTCVKLEDCPKCEEPKVFAKCASKCRPTCQTPNPMFCDDKCDPEVTCVCPPGMVHPRNGDDSCISLSDCPASCRFPTIATECASPCPASCDNPAPTCEGDCNKEVKCICLSGFLQRSKTNTTCLLPTQCPDLPNDCPLRQIATRCASGCPATCQNRNPRFCTKPCRPDVNCECPRGMVQKSLDDTTCVWPHQCEEEE